MITAKIQIKMRLLKISFLFVVHAIFFYALYVKIFIIKSIILLILIKKILLVENIKNHIYHIAATVKKIYVFYALRNTVDIR